MKPKAPKKRNPKPKEVSGMVKEKQYKSGFFGLGFFHEMIWKMVDEDLNTGISVLTPKGKHNGLPLYELTFNTKD